MTNRPPVRDSKSTGLKSCPNPSCGDTHPSIEGDGMGHSWVRCYGCRMTGPVEGTADKARAAWDALPRTVD